MPNNVSQPGVGGVLPSAMAPWPTPVPRRAGPGEGTQTAQTAGAAGGKPQQPPLHGQVGLASVRPSAHRDLRVQVMGLQRSYSRPSGGRLPPTSSLNPRETGSGWGAPDGPTRSLTGPQAPAPCPPRAGLRPSSEAPCHALPALVRQLGPWALVPTTGPPAVKRASKGSSAVPSSQGPARPSPRGRGCPPSVGLGAPVPVWTGGGPG